MCCHTQCNSVGHPVDCHNVPESDGQPFLPDRSARPTGKLVAHVQNVQNVTGSCMHSTACVHANASSDTATVAFLITKRSYCCGNRQQH